MMQASACIPTANMSGNSLSLCPSLWSAEERITGSPLPTVCSAWAAAQNKCCQALNYHGVLHSGEEDRLVTGFVLPLCVPYHIMLFQQSCFLHLILFQRRSEYSRALRELVINWGQVSRAWMKELVMETCHLDEISVNQVLMLCGYGLKR